MDENEVLRVKEMMGALSMQRNQTADMVVELVGEVAVLRKRLEAAQGIAAKTLETAQALENAYHNAIVTAEPETGTFPEKDPEVIRLRALLRLKDE